MTLNGETVTEPGKLIASTLRPLAEVGTDEHRVETARWALENFPPDSQLHKKAAKVLEAYLLGKPLPGA